MARRPLRCPKAAKTQRLISQLRGINGPDSVEELFYGVLAGRPDPESLGDHFALLVDDTEIEAIVDWLGRLA